MQRFRRLRSSEAMRRMVRETRLDAADFIYPIFVAEGENIKKPVDSMPTVYQYSIDRLEEILPQIAQSGYKGSKGGRTLVGGGGHVGRQTCRQISGKRNQPSTACCRINKACQKGQGQNKGVHLYR